jgi:hypothetical protein
MTNVFAEWHRRRSVAARYRLLKCSHPRLTHMRQHASENSERCRGLLVQSPECCPRLILKEVRELHRLRGRHCEKLRAAIPKHSYIIVRRIVF